MNNRVVMLLGEVSTKSVAAVMERMIELSQSPGPILFLINSQGGNPSEAIALHDFIRTLGTEVIGVVCGQAYSSAVLIFQACHKRYVTESSSLMLHPVAVKGDEDYITLEQAKADLRAEVHEDELFRELVARYTEFSAEELMEVENYVTYLYADDILRLNFADGIVTGSIFELGNVMKPKKKTKNEKSS